MARELKPRIIVFGIGGAGGNAVDNMIDANLQGVEFVVANTDAQALSRSKTPHRIQLGPETTSGLGAGARPEIGQAAAEESLDDIHQMLEGAHMVFVAAGMGGGTGTGAAPIIAKAAHDKGILTVGVVTKPFAFEGSRVMERAEHGVEAIRNCVDTMIVIPNQNLFRVANERTTFSEAFRMADDVLYSGVRGITDLIVMPGLINLDFADVQTIMKGMGTAMMGMSEASGEGRALEAAKASIDNPLLDEHTMKGARGVLINISGGYDMTLFEVDEAANEIRAEVDPDATIIIGSAFDPELEGKIRVSVVATGLLPLAASVPAPEPLVPSVPLIETDTPVVVTRDAYEAAAEVEEGPAETADLEQPQEEVRPSFLYVDSLSSGVEPNEEAPAAEKIDDAYVGSDPQSEAEPVSENAGFASLFGWRKSASTPSSDPKEAAPNTENIVSVPEDHLEPAPFDDEDLEIPAFLRRSANN